MFAKMRQMFAVSDAPRERRQPPARRSSAPNMPVVIKLGASAKFVGAYMPPRTEDTVGIVADMPICNDCRRRIPEQCDEPEWLVAIVENVAWYAAGAEIELGELYPVNFDERHPSLITHKSGPLLIAELDRSIADSYENWGLPGELIDVLPDRSLVNESEIAVLLSTQHYRSGERVLHCVGKKTQRWRLKAPLKRHTDVFVTSKLAFTLRRHVAILVDDHVQLSYACASRIFDWPFRFSGDIEFDVRTKTPETSFIQYEDEQLEEDGKAD